MKEVRFFYVPNANSVLELPEEEAQHAVRVLRMEMGDEMMLMDGEGTFYRAIVTESTKKRCLYRIEETLPQERQWQPHLHLAMAPTKNMDRTEWFAEKATEIGFDELTFLRCRWSERTPAKKTQPHRHKTNPIFITSNVAITSLCMRPRRSPTNGSWNPSPR